MNYYNNLVASAYKFYQKYKQSNASGMAVFVVVICQIALLFLILAVLKTFLSIDISYFLRNKGLIIISVIIWIAALFKIYPKSKIERIVSDFNKKTLPQRRIWGVITFLNLFLPIVLGALILNYK